MVLSVSSGAAMPRVGRAAPPPPVPAAARLPLPAALWGCGCRAPAPKGGGEERGGAAAPLPRAPPSSSRAEPNRSRTTPSPSRAPPSRADCSREPYPRPDVLFLHGQAFTSKTWETLGTLALLAGEGYRAVAIDLPGYGDSPPAETVATVQGRVAFLDHLLRELGMQRPVLVSPSMSGRFALPFLLAHGDQLAGFVSIAPVGTKDYTAEQYRRVQTPTLILYGDHDTRLGSQALQSLRHLPVHRVAVVPDAGHACYLDKPEDFHRALLGFLRQMK